MAEQVKPFGGDLDAAAARCGSQLEVARKSLLLLLYLSISFYYLLP